MRFFRSLRQLSTICVSLLCGSAVIESIFSIKGIGEMALEAVYTKDLPLLTVLHFGVGLFRGDYEFTGRSYLFYG